MGERFLKVRGEREFRQMYDIPAFPAETHDSDDLRKTA